MTAHWPQYLILIWTTCRFLARVHETGKQANAGSACSFFAMSTFLYVVPLAILYAGGFFSPLGWGAP